MNAPLNGAPPPNPEINLRLHLQECQVIGEGLQVMPFQRVAELVMRINAQIAQQLSAPPAVQGGVEGAAVTQDRSFPPATQTTYDVAKARLEGAESHRREKAGVLPPAPLPGETPNDDYATALLLVQLALQHLDESIPTGQKERTYAAFQALRGGVRLLEAWLRRRETP